MRKKDYIKFISCWSREQNCDLKNIPRTDTIFDYKNDFSKTWAASYRNVLFCDVINHKLEDPL